MGIVRLQCNSIRVRWLYSMTLGVCRGAWILCWQIRPNKTMLWTSPCQEELVLSVMWTMSQIIFLSFRRRRKRQQRMLPCGKHWQNNVKNSSLELHQGGLWSSWATSCWCRKSLWGDYLSTLFTTLLSSTKPEALYIGNTPTIYWCRRCLWRCNSC